jgi:3,4-dihydroxy 2-butanone 4-phosphate synthase/GTP cyclohydrolase II
MATHGRGLICLALGQERIKQLGLTLMAQDNGTRHETAFTISIEAAQGVTTGISAADRAHTIAIAIDAARGPAHIVSPGHVFPLIAKPGGVLVRAGHTEAAVDVSRLAGLNHSGVICEIMREDGRMARLPDLLRFAEHHRLKIGTIRDLISYRRRHDHLVEKLSEAPFTSDYGGDWRILTYRNKVDLSEAIVLQKGHVVFGQPTMVRVHVTSLLDDMLGRTGERKRLLQCAMIEIGEVGAGIIVLLPQQHGGTCLPLADAENDMDIRAYGVGAQILADLGVHDMVLLSNAHHIPVALSGYDLNIVAERPVRAETRRAA